MATSTVVGQKQPVIKHQRESPWTMLSYANFFLSRAPIEGVKHSHDDYVQIVSGAHAGKFGSLVAVLQLTPEPLFIVELKSGFDVEILQSQITATTR